MTTLSRLWLFLVTLAGGLLMLALLVLLPELQRVRREDQAAGLGLAQRTATLLLAEQAQRLVTAATQLASDAVVQTTLEEMGRGQAELAVLHSTAQLKLQKLSRDKALGASFLLVTDARGRVLARVGQDEAVYRDSLEGWPLVSDALRGYRLDDLWLWQGTLYRVAAAPVVSPARDRYVGALLVAQVVGNELAQLLAKVTSLDAVFLGAGQVVGASLAREQVAVAELVKLRADGSPDRVTVWPGRGEPVAFVELPGTAASQGAALVLIGRSTAGTSAWELARGAAARGLPTPLLLGLIAVMAVIFAVGLLLLRVEVEAPLERLLAAVRRAETTPLALAEGRYRGALRPLVRSLNAALRTAAQTAPPAERPSLGNQTTLPPALERAPVEPPTLQPAPTEMPVTAAPYAAQRATPVYTTPETPVTTAPYAAQRATPVYTTPETPTATAPYGAQRAAPVYTTPDAPLAATATYGAQRVTPMHTTPDGSLVPPSPYAPAPSLLAAPTVSLHAMTAPVTPVGSGSEQTAPGLPVGGLMTPVPLPATPASPSAAVAAPMPTHVHSEETRVAVGVTASDDPQTAYFRVYQDFVLARERCQESVEGLNFDLFSQRLQQSRQQIMNQHSCQTVQFQVHIKDGRATLRATPIWS